MNRRRKGFTLIELLVVIGIIAALAMIGGAAYISAQRRGRNARRAADIQQIRSALEMVRTDFGTYPRSGGANCQTSLGAGNCSSAGSGTTWIGSSDFVVTLNTGYLGNIPNDVLNTTQYYYEYKPMTGAGALGCTTNCARYELKYFEEPITGAVPTPVVVSNP
jgi:prepilin-type N-terminal cleavage/methylation domain-containing protein